MMSVENQFDYPQYSLAEPRLSDQMTYNAIERLAEEKLTTYAQEIVHNNSTPLQSQGNHLHALATLLFRHFPLEDNQMYPYVRYTKISTRRSRPQNIYGSSTIPNLIDSYEMNFRVEEKPSYQANINVAMDCKLPTTIMWRICEDLCLESTLFSIPFVRDIAHPILEVRLNKQESVFINFFQRSVEVTSSSRVHPVYSPGFASGLAFPKHAEALLMSDLIMLGAEALNYLALSNLTDDERNMSMERLVFTAREMKSAFGKENFYFSFFNNALNGLTSN